MRLTRQLLPNDLAACTLLILLSVVTSWTGLRSPHLDMLDAAHHVMDGYFFRDLLVDHPHAHLQQYVLTYYKQYPALGFVFWPPLFPFVLGLFCLVGGVHLFTVRLCILFCGIVFACSFFAVLRRRFTTALAFTAACAAITVPGLARAFNEIMLELPTLAVMCLAVLAYRHLLRGLDRPGSLQRALLCAVACAAVIYTKQPAWFLYPALLADFVLFHRDAARRREIWFALGLIAVLCLPLALFTAKFGHANLAQSVGSNTQLIMANYESIPRWSLAAWTYYPRLAVSQLGFVVVALTLAAFVLAFTRRGFFRENFLWFAWLALFYVTFSFYDNRYPRHATFWWPAWIALAAGTLHVLAGYLPHRLRWTPALLLLVSLPFQLPHAWQETYSDYAGESAAVGAIFGNGNPGNTLLFGPDKQIFIAFIREHDPSRRVHVLRGDPLLKAGLDLPQICHDFRVQTVLIEHPRTGADETTAALLHSAASTPGLQPMAAAPFLRRGQPYVASTFHYAGPVAETEAEIPLSNNLF